MIIDEVGIFIIVHPLVLYMYGYVVRRLVNNNNNNKCLVPRTEESNK